MKLIDGKLVSEKIKEELKEKIEKNHLHPGLAIILANHDSASEIYVRNKIKACEKIGIKALLYQFDENNTEEEIIKCIQKLNEDSTIHGIIVQSPVVPQFHEDVITRYIDPKKDVDGFGIMSLGYLASNRTKFLSATPYGIIKLLEYEQIAIRGTHVVIVGRSKIVGRPLALALLNRDATVTIAHSKTKNLKEITKQADILVVAIGKAKFITDEYIKDGAVVIDVGINRIEGKLYGDVDQEAVSKKALYLTPVPGGVGPMTIAMLLSNVVDSALAEREEIKHGSKN